MAIDESITTTSTISYEFFYYNGVKLILPSTSRCISAVLLDILMKENV